MEERDACRHCGAPTGWEAQARQRLLEAAIQQRLLEAAIRYALATRPNGHPVDTEFRHAVSDFTRLDRDDLCNLDHPGVGGPH